MPTTYRLDKKIEYELNRLIEWIRRLERVIAELEARIKQLENNQGG